MVTRYQVTRYQVVSTRFLVAGPRARGDDDIKTGGKDIMFYIKYKDLV